MMRTIARIDKGDTSDRYYDLLVVDEQPAVEPPAPELEPELEPAPEPEPPRELTPPPREPTPSKPRTPTPPLREPTPTPPRIPTPPPLRPDWWDDPVASPPMRFLQNELFEAKAEVQFGAGMPVAISKLGKFILPARSAQAVAESAELDSKYPTTSGGTIPQKDVEAREKARREFADKLVIDGRLQRGLNLQLISLWSHALEDYDKAIGSGHASDAQLQKLLWTRAQLHDSSERYEEALEDLFKLLPEPHGDAEPGIAFEAEAMAEAMELRARVHHAMGALPEALAEYQRVTKLFPGRKGAWLAFAQLLGESGEVASPSMVLESLAAASLLEPTDEKLMHRCADLFESIKDLRRGIEHLGELIKRGAGNGALLRRAKMRMVLARMNRGKECDDLFKGACDDLTLLLKSDPVHAEALLCRGCLEAKSNRRRALEDFHTAAWVVDFAEDTRANMARGLTYESDGKPHEAIAEYLEASRRGPQLGRGFPLVAVALVHRHFFKDASMAIYFCTRSIKTDPTYLKAYMIRAECFFGRGDTARALSDINRALHMNPGLPLLLALHARYALHQGEVRVAAADCWSLAQIHVSTHIDKVKLAAEAANLAAAAAASVPAPRLAGATTGARGQAGAPEADEPRMAPGLGTYVAAGAKDPKRDTRNSMGASTMLEASSPGVTAQQVYAEIIELMSECALLLGRPRDAAALLAQLVEQKKPGFGGSATFSGPPLRLSLLAVAWQCAREPNRALAVSDAAMPLAAKLSASPADMSLFWLRRGHLLLATQKPVDALEAYAKAISAEPDAAAPKEASAWASHLAAPLHRKDATYAKIRATYDGLVKDRPKFNRARLHRAHLLWRAGELRLAAAELSKVAEQTTASQRAVRATALVFRGLVNVCIRQYGAALTDLNDALCHQGGERHALPVHIEHVARFARGTALLRVNSLPAAHRDLHAVASVRGGALERRGSDAEAASLAAESGKADASLALVRASQMHLAFCTNLSLGIASWRLGKPADSLDAFLSSHRSASSLAKLQAQHADSLKQGGTDGYPQMRRRSEKVDDSVAHAAAADVACERQVKWPVGAPPPLTPRARAASHVAAGLALHKLARLDDATVHFAVALELQPKCLAALIGHGDLHLDMGQLREARRAYSRAAMLCPNSASPRVCLARLMHHVGDADGAWLAVEQAFALSSIDADVYEARAVLQLAKGNLPAARDDMRAALGARNAPGPGTLRWKAWMATSATVSAALSDTGTATRDFAAAARADLSSAVALGGLGAIQLSRRLWENAAALYEEALRVLDEDDERYALSDRYVDASSFSAGESAPPPAAPPPVEAGAGCGGAGVAASANGALQVAGEKSADDVAPASAVRRGTEYGTLGRQRIIRGRSALGAGVALLMLNQISEATKRLDEAVALRPACGHSLFNRAVLRMITEDWEAAERDLLNCTKLMPVCAEAWMRKSTAVLKQEAGRKRQVLVDYANALLVVDWQANRVQ